MQIFPQQGIYAIQFANPRNFKSSSFSDYVGITMDLVERYAALFSSRKKDSGHLNTSKIQLESNY
jgi:hypothetical protein